METGNSPAVWKEPLGLWGLILFICTLLGFLFYEGLYEMVQKWSRSDEYGYGFLIPILVIFFIWQKKDQLERLPFPGSWAGFLLVFLGIGVLILGELSTLYILTQYALVIVLFGTFLAFTGWEGMRKLWIPLLFLFFMIPLPNFLYQNLSGKLQLISSELGVDVIRLFGVSVYLEGNIIDLGTYKLQVVEACSGLRYLFPLASLAFIAAYLFRGAFWKKAVIFLSSLPITVFMNVFRIGVIGALVEYTSIAAAEGFLHDFEGWVIFMACVLILVAEMWLLARIGPDRLSLREAFALELPGPTPKDTEIQYRTPPGPFWAVTVLLALALIPILLLEQRIEIPPERGQFSNFPTTLSNWQGRQSRLDAIYLDALKLDDYVLADYIDDSQIPVNLYVAYYDSQRKGESAHSPRSCIPGGGWQIKDLTQKSLATVTVNGAPLKVNRVFIQNGDYKRLVYYWFQQRGRNITNEYLVKWFLFWDALTRNRTDGALVRLITPISPGEEMSSVDDRLSKFANAVASPLTDYIPD